MEQGVGVVNDKHIGKQEMMRAGHAGNKILGKVPQTRDGKW